MCEEDIYEYGGQYMPKPQLYYAMSTCSGTWTANKVGTFTRFSEIEPEVSLNSADYFKIITDYD